MKITLIHGQNRKGSTYHIARMTAEKIGGDIDEFFLPKDLSEGCLGCFTCADKGREFCPHNRQVGEILRSMLLSDIIIIGSPTYVLEMTGHLKSFFDHMYTVWLSHRPEQAMFRKIAVVISTAAGSGMSGVVKRVARQLFYMGVPKVYRLPVRVAAMSWDGVKIKDKIQAKTDTIAHKINSKHGKVKPGIKLRFIFFIMRQMHKGNDWTPLDKKHWEDNGWFGKSRPWKD